MSHRNNQAGFSGVVLLVTLAVIAAVALVGIRMRNASQQTLSSSASHSVVNKSPTATNVKTAPAVSSTNDLNAAAATLDQTDPASSNSADSGQLDGQTAAF